VTTLISYQSSGGGQGRCNAKCYDAAEPDCTCICGGRNHGAGKEQAIDNTRELAASWLKHARANGKDITRTELAADALHEPLFRLGATWDLVALAALACAACVTGPGMRDAGRADRGRER
jgi:hypothetical protein